MGSDFALKETTFYKKKKVIVFTKKKDKVYIKFGSTEGQSHVRGQVNKDYRDKDVTDKKNKTFILKKGRDTI